MARCSYTEFVTSIDAPRTYRIGTFVAAAALGLAVLAGCGGEGSATNCNLNSCTVTFDRGVDASVSVLGVDAKLVDVQNSQATLDIEGQKLTIPVGQDAQADGFNVSVQSITADNVVVRIAAA